MSADIKEIYDTLYYGGEIEFRYKNNCYMMEAAYPDGKPLLTLWKIASTENGENTVELYNKCFQSKEQGIEDMLSAKVFNNNSFSDIVNEIEIDFIA